MDATIGDGSTPVYSFEWDDGSSRRTDEGVPDAQNRTTAIETLAELGRRDPDCEVELVGFE
jgi:hypothetical protein